MKKLTEYHKTWLQENYGRVSREECAWRLKCSSRTVDRWVSELGLQTQTRKPKDPSKPSKPSKIKPSKDVEVKPSVEALKGYCMDCEHYIFGGHCGKNGKPTGALNEKPCFKQNTL